MNKTISKIKVEFKVVKEYSTEIDPGEYTRSFVFDEDRLVAIGELIAESKELPQNLIEAILDYEEKLYPSSVERTLEEFTPIWKEINQ